MIQYDTVRYSMYIVQDCHMRIHCVFVQYIYVQQFFFQFLTIKLPVTPAKYILSYYSIGLLTYNMYYEKCSQYQRSTALCYRMYCICKFNENYNFKCYEVRDAAMQIFMRYFHHSIGNVNKTASISASYPSWCPSLLNLIGDMT